MVNRIVLSLCCCFVGVIKSQNGAAVETFKFYKNSLGFEIGTSFPLQFQNNLLSIDSISRKNQFSNSPNFILNFTVNNHKKIFWEFGLGLDRQNLFFSHLRNAKINYNFRNNFLVLPVVGHLQFDKKRIRATLDAGLNLSILTKSRYWINSTELNSPVVSEIHNISKNYTTVNYRVLLGTTIIYDLDQEVSTYLKIKYFTQTLQNIQLHKTQLFSGLGLNVGFFGNF